MVRLVVMCGISGSGKTYWAHHFFNGYTVISSDDIREELYGDASIQLNPRKVFGILHERVEANLAAGINTVLDATNLTKKWRKDIIARYKDKAFLICAVTPVDASRAIYNQMLRDRKVPESIILKQVKQFTMPTEDEGWDEILMLEEDKHEVLETRVYRRNRKFAEDFA